MEFLADDIFRKNSNKDNVDLYATIISQKLNVIWKSEDK